MHNLYIGACAKSGTHTVTEFLNTLGIEVGHEWPGKDGLVSWHIFGTPLHFPAEYTVDVENSICLHQTREPLTTISSLMLLDDDSWRYIRRATAMDLSRPLLWRCMYFYHYWNKNLEDCTFRYRVEDIEELIDILDLFKVPYDKTKIDLALKIPRAGITHSMKPVIKWANLYDQDYILADMIADMAEQYEYNYN